MWLCNINIHVLADADSDGDNAISYEEFERALYFCPEVTE